MAGRKNESTVSRKKRYAIFDNKGFHIIENNGTIQIDELRDISPDQEEADKKSFLI